MLPVAGGSLNKTKDGTELVCHIFCHRFNAGSRRDEKGRRSSTVAISFSGTLSPRYTCRSGAKRGSCRGSGCQRAPF